MHGRFHRNDAWPTVTVYNHLDVQPASKETEPWKTEPFTFAKEGDKYLGRGTTDDKGPALAALFGRGHLLIEDVPGTGKTVLAKAIAQAAKVGAS